jgi:DNA-directed RNA polymerase beta' subunit
MLNKQGVIMTKQATQSKAQAIFAKSVSSIMANRSTGNAKLDQVGSKILYGINEGRLQFAGSKEDGYTGTLGQAEVTISKVAHGEKSTRTVLEVAGMSIQGEFAARAFKMAEAQIKKASGTSRGVVVDEDQVDEVSALLDAETAVEAEWED